MIDILKLTSGLNDRNPSALRDKMATGLQPADGRQRHAVSQIPLYPLRFEPIYQYRLWGGRRLAKLLKAPLIKLPDGQQFTTKVMQANRLQNRKDVAKFFKSESVKPGDPVLMTEIQPGMWSLTKL